MLSSQREPVANAIASTTGTVNSLTPEKKLIYEGGSRNGRVQIRAVRPRKWLYAMLGRLCEAAVCLPASMFEWLEAREFVRQVLADVHRKKSLVDLAMYDFFRAIEKYKKDDHAVRVFDYFLTLEREPFPCTELRFLAVAWVFLGLTFKTTKQESSPDKKSTTSTHVSSTTSAGSVGMSSKAPASQIASPVKAPGTQRAEFDFTNESPLVAADKKLRAIPLFPQLPPVISLWDCGTVIPKLFSGAYGGLLVGSDTHAKLCSSIVNVSIESKGGSPVIETGKLLQILVLVWHEVRLESNEGKGDSHALQDAFRATHGNLLSVKEAELEESIRQHTKLFRALYRARQQAQRDAQNADQDIREETTGRSSSSPSARRESPRRESPAAKSPPSRRSSVSRRRSSTSLHSMSEPPRESPRPDTHAPASPSRLVTPAERRRLRSATVSSTQSSPSLSVSPNWARDRSPRPRTPGTSGTRDKSPLHAPVSTGSLGKARGVKGRPGWNTSVKAEDYTAEEIYTYSLFLPGGLQDSPEKEAKREEARANALTMRDFRRARPKPLGRVASSPEFARRTRSATTGSPRSPMSPLSRSTGGGGSGGVRNGRGQGVGSKSGLSPADKKAERQAETADAAHAVAAGLLGFKVGQSRAADPSNNDGGYDGSPAVEATDEVDLNTSIPTTPPRRPSPGRRKSVSTRPRSDTQKRAPLFAPDASGSDA